MLLPPYLISKFTIRVIFTLPHTLSWRDVQQDHFTFISTRLNCVEFLFYCRCTPSLLLVWYRGLERAGRGVNRSWRGQGFNFYLRLYSVTPLKFVRLNRKRPVLRSVRRWVIDEALKLRYSA